MKFTSKSPYVGIWNFVKKSDIFYHFTNVSKFLILQKKTKKKKYGKTIEKDTEITIDNVIFKFFNKKKVILSKKSIFRLIMTSNIFHLKIIFYIGKMVSKNFWLSKKSFPSNNTALSNRPPPPPVLLGKRQKVPKFYLWVLRRKLEKHDYQSWNGFYQNFRKNTYLWGVWRKFSKICPSFKG